MPTTETNTQKNIRQLEADGWVNVGGGAPDRFKSLK